MRAAFSQFARLAACTVGSPWAFGVAILVTLAWLAAGPFLNWSTEWNFWANTTTTVATTLLVLLLQHTQNHDTIALQAKLDELIAATKGARNELIAIEKDKDEAGIEEGRHERSPNGEQPT